MNLLNDELDRIAKLASEKSDKLRRVGKDTATGAAVGAAAGHVGGKLLTKGSRNAASENMHEHVRRLTRANRIFGARNHDVLQKRLYSESSLGRAKDTAKEMKDAMMQRNNAANSLQHHVLGTSGASGDLRRAMTEAHKDEMASLVGGTATGAAVGAVAGKAYRALKRHRLKSAKKKMLVRDLLAKHEKEQAKKAK